jgi:signal transduction histidine kinase
MKILIVDDEKFNLVIANDFIKKTDIECEVTLCDDPLKVEAMFKENDFDIVLLDIVMPKNSGIDVLKQLRSNPEYNNVKIIMLTSLANDESFKTCFENGADDYIYKPIKEVEFFARFKAAVKTRNNAKMLKEMFERIKKQNKELKELNQILKDTQFQMLQKEKLAAVGGLAAGVAHEINNPLAYLGSNLETLSNFVSKIQVVDQEYRSFIEKLDLNKLCSEKDIVNKYILNIKELEKNFKIDFVISEIGEIINDSKDGINRVSKIVQSLQNFAKTGFEDKVGLYDLNMIIDESILLLNSDLKNVGTIEKRYGLTPLMLCDKSQIGQAILSLITNSLQAIKGQKRVDGEIIIETFQEGNMICCRICDDGPGIDENIKNKIFNPFFTTKEVGSAMGVGLSISYDIIVKKYNGEFMFESILGKKTIFTIKLPMQK